MPAPRRGIPVAAAGLLLIARSAAAWIAASPSYPSIYLDVVLDTAGDVFVAGRDGAMLVEKRTGGTGVLVWDMRFATGRAALFVATDGAGDVYVNGSEDFLVDEYLRVAKLDGTAGTVLWERTYVDASAGTFSDTAHLAPVVVGPDGDVFTAASHEGTGLPTIVVRLDASTGSEVWQRVLASQKFVGPGYDERQLVVDTAGDVAIVTRPIGADEVVVTKLDGDTGATLWTHTVTLPDGPNQADLGLAADDPVVIVDTADSPVVKLDGATGSELWRHDSGSPSTDGFVIGPDGTVYVRYAASLVRLDGASGTVDWIESTYPEPYTAVLVAEDGNLIVTQLDAFGESPATMFRRRSAATGALLWEQPLFGPANEVAPFVVVDELRSSPRGIVGMANYNVFEVGTRLAGRKLVLKENPGDATRNLLKVSVKDAVFTAPASSEDGAVLHPQDPTVGGATLTLENPGTAEMATFVLPAARWTPKPSNRVGRQGYRYQDPTANPGCRAVLGGGKLKVVCRGTLGGFTLDEASQGTLRVSLAIGTGGPLHCLEFGGAVTKDTGTAGGAGAFLASSASPPVSCDGI